MKAPLLQFVDVSKQYQTSGRRSRAVLRDVNLTVASNRAIAIKGRSGSGKSTLLYLAAGIESPSSGRILVRNEDLTQATETRRTSMRREQIGLVFQFFHLLGHLSVLDNVLLAAWIGNKARGSCREKALELLDRVGMRERQTDPVQKLSGGEMQRVAICRALIGKPSILLADEPTGNLDDENSRLVLDLLLDLCRQEQSSLLYVTHSSELAAAADEVWHLHSGILET